MQKDPLDRYEGVIDALRFCSAKLRKSFKTASFQMMILLMTIPQKINFTRMGRYSDRCVPRFRRFLERDFDRMEFNTAVMKIRFCDG